MNRIAQLVREHFRLIVKLSVGMHLQTSVSILRSAVRDVGHLRSTLA